MLEMILTLVEGINWESTLARFLVMLIGSVFLGALIASPAFRWIMLAIVVLDVIALDTKTDRKY